MTNPKSVTAIDLCSKQYPINPGAAKRNYEVHGYTVIAKNASGERVVGAAKAGHGNVRLILEDGRQTLAKAYDAIHLEYDYSPVGVHGAARPILAKYQTVIPLTGGGVRLKGLTSPNPKEWSPETKAQVEKYLSKELVGQVRISDRAILWNGKQVGHIGALYGEIVAKLNSALMASAEEKDYVLPLERTGNLAEDDTTVYAAARSGMRKEARPQGEWKGFASKGGKVYERVYTDDDGTRWIVRISENEDGTFDATVDSAEFQRNNNYLTSGAEARVWAEATLKQWAKAGKGGMGKRFGSVHGPTDQRNFAYLGEPMVLRQGTNTARLAVPVEYIDATGKRQKRTVEYDVTFEWEGDHVVDVERPNNRDITRALSAKQVTLVEFPTAMQVEMALQGNTIEDEDESFARVAKPVVRKAYNAYNDKMKPAIKALMDAERKFGRRSDEYNTARFDYLDALDSYMAHISDWELYGHATEYAVAVEGTNNLMMPWDATIEVNDPRHLTVDERRDLSEAYSRAKGEETE